MHLGRLFSFIILSMFACLSACGSYGGSPTEPQRCTTPGCSIPQPLAVISSDPANGATDVPRAQCPYATSFCRGIVMMTFNQSVNIDSMNFQIVPSKQGALRCPDPQFPGPGTYGCRVTPPTTVPPNQSAIVWYDTLDSFLPTTKYTVTILAVNSSDGKPLGTYTFSFTTAAQ
jgi:hypothetical protein